MKIRLLISLLLLSCFILPAAAEPQPHYPAGTDEVSIPNVNGVRTSLLKNIAPIVEKSISQGEYPGAVILAAHRGHIIYRGVFGNQSILPTVTPMHFNTIFDLASVTKVIVTTPAVMQLIEEGKIDLDAPVEKYWPAFGQHGKETITIRELLTHTSGLPPDIGDDSWRGEAEALHKIEKLKPTETPGTHFLYSDVNFVVLAYLVELISHESFAHYVQTHILKPLAMNNTFFNPSPLLRKRIAPTEVINNKIRWGEVHDPIAYAMGGVSGNAGLFSDANDLGVYAQCLLNGGRLPKTKNPAHYLLGPLAILKMITPETPPNMADKRGLGWDIDSPYSNRGVLFPVESFGHTGWTGTSIWIDPATQTWIIILTSRTHPKPASHNQLIQDRRDIANIISASITDVSLTANKINTGQGEIQRAYSNETPSHKTINISEMTKHTVCYTARC